MFSDALNATILGGVKLIDLIQAVTGHLRRFAADAQAMQILYSTVEPTASDGSPERRPRATSALITPPIPTTRTTHFNWSPDIVDNNPIVTKDRRLIRDARSFDLDGVVTADLANPANSTFTLTGDAARASRQADEHRSTRRRSSRSTSTS